MEKLAQVRPKPMRIARITVCSSRAAAQNVKRQGEWSSQLQEDCIADGERGRNTRVQCASASHAQAQDSLAFASTGLTEVKEAMRVCAQPGLKAVDSVHST